MVCSSRRGWKGIKLCLFTPGPGLKPAEERAVEDLEEVALGVAKGISNKKVLLTKRERASCRVSETWLP